MRNVATSPARARGRTRRLVGIDVARALAFGGMLASHYAFPRRLPEADGTGATSGDPGWLQGLDAAADGRAAPLFCVVLGVGAGFLARAGARDHTFVLRGLALFAIGLAIWPYQEAVYLILPHYGLLLALVPLWRRIPTAWLLPAAAVAFVVPSLVTAVLDDHRMRSAIQPDSYEALRDVGALARYLLWTGGYPLVGWVGFVLVGLWLARLRLGDQAVQLSLLFGGVLVMLSQPVLASARVELGPRSLDVAGGLATMVDGTAHSNRTAWYVLATATAIAVIAACLLATASPRGERLLWPLAALGQMALTAYLAHLVIGEELVWDWQEASDPSLAAQLLVALATFLSLMVAATLWRRRFRRGPVEALLRAIAR